MKTAHFLRPDFTKLIIQRLERGGSLNLYGPPGIGKTRLLEDIEQADTGMRVVRVSFKGCQYSLKEFCHSTWLAAGLVGDAPGSFGKVIDELCAEGRHVALLVDDFQEYLNNPALDKAFDQSFADSLNSVRNRPGVSLVAVTERAMKGLVVFIDGKAKNSPLNLACDEVLPLADANMKKEIRRRLGKDIDDRELSVFSAVLLDGSCCYSFLKYSASRIKEGHDSHLGLRERLDRWRAGFNKTCRIAPSKHVVRMTNGMTRWVAILNPFKNMAMQLKKILAGPWAVIAGWFGKLFGGGNNQ